MSKKPFQVVISGYCAAVNLRLMDFLKTRVMDDFPRRARRESLSWLHNGGILNLAWGRWREGAVGERPIDPSLILSGLAGFGRSAPTDFPPCCALMLHMALPHQVRAPPGFGIVYLYIYIWISALIERLHGRATLGSLFCFL